MIINSKWTAGKEVHTIGLGQQRTPLVFKILFQLKH